MNLFTLRHEQALVIGDGLTGLLAAQALTRFFRQVAVVEQPPAVEPPYLLNGRDQAALGEMFPGLLAELAGAGAIRFNLGLHVAWSVNGRWRPRYRSAYDPVVCQPDLLLATIRKRLVGETAVQFHAAAHQSRFEAAAGLIVDTTGQANGTQNNPALLAGAGCLYQWPAGYQTSWQMLVIAPACLALAPQRGAVVLRISGDRFSLALWGTAADPPPLDEVAFLTFARSLPHPDLAKLLAQAVPLAAVMPLPIADWAAGPPLPPANRVQPAIPGLLPNPLLGHPASYALTVRSALVESLLEAGLEGMNGRFRYHLAHQLRPIRQLVQAEACRWAVLNRGDSSDLASYLARITAGSLHSAPLLETLYAVQQGLYPLTRLFEPDVVLQTMG